jgi:serine protease Do
MMNRLILIALMFGYAPSLLAWPSFAETIPIGFSIVMVTTDLPGGSSGRGSGVVVSKEYVATDCHVIANTNGVSINKFRDAYKPIAIKANWRRDLCLLKFDSLPLTPIPMRDSSTLKYEEEVFSLGFPSGANVPQPSYGNVKGKYAYDNGQIIRTDASFALGSSGGGLFDEKYNLIGITTFKSPGHQGFFYSLPVEWIKELLDSPDVISLKTNEVPFWALPAEQRPYFMKVVTPYQNKEWPTLKTIAQEWTVQEPSSSDAWYFLGVAEEGIGEVVEAKAALEKATQLNSHDLDAFLALSRLAYQQKDLNALVALKTPVEKLSSDEGEKLSLKIDELKYTQ